MTSRLVARNRPEVGATDVNGIGSEENDCLTHVQTSEDASWGNPDLVPANVGVSSTGQEGGIEAKDRCSDLRAQVFWKLRKLFRPDGKGRSQISIPDDPDLKKQLSDIRRKYSSERKIKTEPKE